MNRLLGVTLLAGALLGAVSCGKDGVSSGPGTLQVRLTSPAANSGLDSAIVLTISGPAALTSATAGNGLRLFAQPLGGTTTKFALTGRLTNGATILTIGVVDVGSFSQYNGSIQGVALPNYTLRTLTGYALAVTR